MPKNCGSRRHGLSAGMDRRRSRAPRGLRAEAKRSGPGTRSTGLGTDELDGPRAASMCQRAAVHRRMDPTPRSTIGSCAVSPGSCLPHHRAVRASECAPERDLAALLRIAARGLLRLRNIDSAQVSATPVPVTIPVSTRQYGYATRRSDPRCAQPTAWISRSVGCSVPAFAPAVTPARPWCADAVR